MPESAAAFKARLLGSGLGDLATGRVLRQDAATDALVAGARMKAEETDCVLVGRAGKLAEIVTDRDAMLKLAGRSGSAPVLGALMTPHPEVLRAGETVATAIHKMAVGKSRHVPLTDDDGSITLGGARDIFRHLAERLA